MRLERSAEALQQEFPGISDTSATATRRYTMMLCRPILFQEAPEQHGARLFRI